MTKVFVLSTVLGLSALGMACGDAANTNVTVKPANVMPVNTATPMATAPVNQATPMTPPANAPKANVTTTPAANAPKATMTPAPTATKKP